MYRSSLLDRVLQSAPATHVVLKPSLRGLDETRQLTGTVIAGGSLSPLFLCRDSGAPRAAAVPYTQNLRSARAVVASAGASFERWVPFMEQIAKLREALVLVCDDLEDRLLEALLVNDQHRTLRVGVVKPSREDLATVAERLGTRVIEPGAVPGDATSFPRLDEVIVRADAMQVLGAGTDTLVELTIGGRHADEVAERLTATLDRLQSHSP